jgi:hypothetical protein
MVSKALWAMASPGSPAIVKSWCVGLEYVGFYDLQMSCLSGLCTGRGA